MIIVRLHEAAGKEETHARYHRGKEVLQGSVTLSLRSRAGSERRDGAGSPDAEILRYAQDDRLRSG